MCQFSDVTTAAAILLSPFIQSVGKDIQPTSAYAYFPGNLLTQYHRSEGYLYALLRWQPNFEAQIGK